MFFIGKNITHRTCPGYFYLHRIVAGVVCVIVVILQKVCFAFVLHVRVYVSGK